MSGPAISDSALLRFLDRGGGLDVEQLRAALSAALERAHAAATAIGGGDYVIRKNGLVFAVRGGVVTTVTNDGGPVVSAATLAQRYV